MTVVTGVWGGMSLQELSRLRDVAASGSCQRDQPSMGKVRVELHSDCFTMDIFLADE